MAANPWLGLNQANKKCFHCALLLNVLQNNENPCSVTCW